MRRTVVFLVLITGATLLCATPFWTAEDFLNFEQKYSARARYTDTADTTVYYTFAARNICYPAFLRGICDFTAFWQLADTDSNEFGGIIEAESGELRDVIQTDNTQESIIIWSIYQTIGEWNDFDTSLARSWEYVANFPAYNEEVSDESRYYPVWNSGLALLAVFAYTNATGDSSKLAYGDSCAEFIITEELPLYGTATGYDLLHTFVTAFVAGCLAEYGNFRGVDSFNVSASQIALRAKLWAESHPSRAFASSSWAMSPGTLIWGLMHAYFPMYPDEFEGFERDFIDTYLPMDAGRADHFDDYLWDNSWNIWFANGYRALYEYTGSEHYHDNFVRITDYLLSQDRDFDWGIPSSFAHPDSMDMTWVSTYVVFMALEELWTSLPETKLCAERVRILGTPKHYYRTGDTLDVEIALANGGTDVVWGFSSRLSSGSLGRSGMSGSLSYLHFAIETMRFPVLGDESADGFLLWQAFHETGEDSLRIDFPFAPDMTCTLVFTDTLGNAVNTTISVRDTFATAAELGTYASDLSGKIVLTLPQLGTFDVNVTPVFPYPRFSLRLDLTPNISRRLGLPRPQVILVCDADGEFAEIFGATLDSLDMLHTVFNTAEHSSSDLEGLGNFSNLRTIFWFTGNSTSTLLAADRMALASFIDNGGRAILNGQFIAEGIETTTFWHTYISAEVTSSGIERTMWDVTSTPATIVTSSGAGSAENQTSIDKMTPPADATIWLVKTSVVRDADVIAFSRTFAGGGALFFSSLGFEGIGKLYPTAISRKNFISKLLTWADTTFICETNASPRPSKEELFAFPNPFNSTVSIVYSGDAQLEILDISGKHIGTLPRVSGTNVRLWKPLSTCASGIYFVRPAGQNHVLLRLTYLK